MAVDFSSDYFTPVIEGILCSKKDLKVVVSHGIGVILLRYPDNSPSGQFSPKQLAPDPQITSPLVLLSTTEPNEPLNI